MKRIIPVAVFIVGLAMVGLAQTSMTPGMQNAPARKSPLAGYAGAWIGTFDGHAWLTVRLNQQGTAMAGMVQHLNDMKFTDQGEIKSVGEEQVVGAVDSAVLNGDGLLITVKDNGTQQTDRYMMRLTGADTAELKMVAMSMPPGMAKPKPWKLSRVGPNAVTPAR
ncbi:MAG: hypothetical protein ABR902_05035 [Candidatus Korobacteraceae bacterium]|jgi:hypothetical protein